MSQIATPPAKRIVAPRCEVCQAYACFGVEPPAAFTPAWRCRAHVWPDFLPADRARLAASAGPERSAPDPATPEPGPQPAPAPARAVRPDPVQPSPRLKPKRHPAAAAQPGLF